MPRRKHASPDHRVCTDPTHPWVRRDPSGWEIRIILLPKGLSRITGYGVFSPCNRIIGRAVKLRIAVIAFNAILREIRISASGKGFAVISDEFDQLTGSYLPSNLDVLRVYIPKVKYISFKELRGDNTPGGYTNGY